MKTKKMAAALAVVCSCAWFSGGVDTDVSAARTSVEPTASSVAVTAAHIIPMPAGYVLLDQQTGDVTGDGQADQVYLIGKRLAENPQFAKSLQLLVYDRVADRWLELGLGNAAGFEVTMTLKNFTGNNADNVLVQAASGGSGGWYHNYIASFTDKPQLVFGEAENETYFVNGQFADDYTAVISGSQAGKVSIDVSERKADYERLGLYNQQGKLLKPTQLMVRPFGKLEPIDLNGDGVYELRGRQGISGAYGADGLAIVDTVLSYRGGKWQPQSVAITLTLSQTKL